MAIWRSRTLGQRVTPYVLQVIRKKGNHFAFFFFKICLFIQSYRENKRQNRSTISCFTPQRAALVRAGLGEGRKPGASYRTATWPAGAETLGHLPLP